MDFIAPPFVRALQGEEKHPSPIKIYVTFFLKRSKGYLFIQL
jgi:hypothetical protein